MKVISFFRHFAYLRKFHITSINLMETVAVILIELVRWIHAANTFNINQHPVVIKA